MMPLFRAGVLNPRTYKQSHTHAVVQGEGGGGDGTPLQFLVMLQYFEKISPLVESLLCALQVEVHIMGCRGAGRGGCDVNEDGRHFGRHLGFYRKLEIVKNVKKWMLLMLYL